MYLLLALKRILNIVKISVGIEWNEQCASINSQ
uniref:Uncharacterized protein n=1 Tax=Anopheles albimanus TaxID=7167 RepID=A0A182FYX4_ANOAL